MAKWYRMQARNPSFVAATGALTASVRDDYIRRKLGEGSITESEAADAGTLSFQARRNTSTRLFFWQLYSVLGMDRIVSIVTAFYEKVLSDSDAPWFREAFASTGDLAYHVKGQTLFWADVMAGGISYEGGMRRVMLKHKMSSDVMNEIGAKRWMHHMQAAIAEHSDELNALDPRIIPCVVDFLQFFMNQYSTQFDFNMVPWMKLLSDRISSL
jgi:truncated hemoglobin YjbI